MPKQYMYQFVERKIAGIPDKGTAYILVLFLALPLIVLKSENSFDEHLNVGGEIDDVKRII